MDADRIACKPYHQIPLNLPFEGGFREIFGLSINLT